VRLQSCSNRVAFKVVTDANDPFSWYLLGRAYMAGGNYGKAYEAYQQAVYRDGKNPAFWCSIGVLYYQINQFHDALDAVRVRAHSSPEA
jgi:glucose repression mediator protein